MKKEHYRHRLPHFHSPGQTYFITWCLQSATPRHALGKYTFELESLQKKMELAKKGISHIDKIQLLKEEYRIMRKKYMKALHDFLDDDKYPEVDLSKPENSRIISNSLLYWENEKLRNLAILVMPNHVHWVVEAFDKDRFGELVYLQDVLYSIKRFSAARINRQENRSGRLWQKESFDTTIRDEDHLQKSIIYTLNNPLKAGLCCEWKEWPGNWVNEEYREIMD
ncbi:transposase [Marinilabilia rubra]|uniref:Transposase IS200-like domain-containing protein n=1 Tax=Marinilabilia rubra TaxID=2162893 RepID=A0A2U2BCD7_9BACT|nr:transposase [Marinilabilia rubra]PWE00697.1 hypothetical protein DDZ16_03635 [Marinilabilia rubra]